MTHRKWSITVDTSDLDIGAGLALATALILYARHLRHAPAQIANRHPHLAQLDGIPLRRFYRGPLLRRAIAIADLRARAHRRMPRLVTEYIEGGAEDEATLAREREAFADWRFVPRTLVDVSKRSLRTTMLGKPVSMPVVVAPTGMNGLIQHRGDLASASAAAKAGVPFVQSTMSNDSVEDIAAIRGLRHWWQLYIFGDEPVWRKIVQRAYAASCEALVVTTNTQIFGNREWSRRTRIKGTWPTGPATLDAALHPLWLMRTLIAAGGLPVFQNVIDVLPRGQRSLFKASRYIRAHQPQCIDWETIAHIRDVWRRPLLVKGLLNIADVRRAHDMGLDGIVLSSHGGRQLDWTIAPLDLLPAAREVAGTRMEVYVAGGIRRGTDILKAVALGANGVFVGRAPLYGLAAYGGRGAFHALEILRRESFDALGLVGAADLRALDRNYLVPAGSLTGNARDLGL